VLLIGIAALIVLTPNYFIAGLVLLTMLIVVIEAVLRGVFIQTVGSLTMFLAMISAVILFFHFWYWILISVLLATAFFLMAQRLRELE
jgi:hypothetical protein